MKTTFRRYLAMSLKARRDFALTFIQPLVYLVFFGPLFVTTMKGPTRRSPNTGLPWCYCTPDRLIRPDPLTM